MTTDSPDWYTRTEAATLRATSIQGGLDADKSASPVAEDVYLARDTGILYVCFTSGTWTNIGILYLLLAGGTMSGAIAMGTNKITGMGDPTAAQDAATRAYVLSQILDWLLKTGGTMSGAIAMGTNKITGLAAPTAAADAARKTDVDTVDAKLDDVTQAQPTRLEDTIYQNTSGKLRLVTISCSLGSAEGYDIRVDSVTPPVVIAAHVDVGNGGVQSRIAVAVIVPPNYYYRCATVAGSPAINKWTEWDLL